MATNGDLNNTAAIRQAVEYEIDPKYRYYSHAIPLEKDDSDIRDKYRPFLQSPAMEADDWASDRLRILVLYGSLRSRSFSRLLAYEAARVLFRLGCDVRVYDPRGLPQKDDVQHDHPKVQELRDLSKWSDGHVWVSPEQHGNLTGIFKQQIDWIPLSTGSVRPTQGRTLAVAQVNGGSQSFNAV
ncbi:hypothetical protein Golomagni_05994, partial [Golovinomyces magnicellulatus]